MRITAEVDNSRGVHDARVTTEGVSQSVAIASRASGNGSSLNGGELLFLALATCYCNDIYREAKKRGLEVTRVTVDVEGDFGAEGGPAWNVRYRARVASKAHEDAIRELMLATDRLAEIHNSLRVGTPVELAGIEVDSE